MSPVYHYYNFEEIEPEQEQYIQPLSDSCKELISTAFETLIPTDQLILAGGYHNYGSFGLTYTYGDKRIRVEGATDDTGRVDVNNGPDVYWDSDE